MDTGCDDKLLFHQDHFVLVPPEAYNSNPEMMMKKNKNKNSWQMLTPKSEAAGGAASTQVLNNQK